MKKITTPTKLAAKLILAALLLTGSAFAQAPQKMTYQAVVRNSSNVLVQSSPVGMKVSILQGSVTGTAVYVETHTAQTNQNGLLDIVIGGGTIVSGTYINGIFWAGGPYFLKTEIDPLGGTAYTITSTSEFLAVPYALHAYTSTYYLGHYVGELYQGGIVVAIWKDSINVEHGLLMSLTDVSTASYLAGAITICDGYINGVYSDWRLPSQDELFQCFNSRYITGNILGAQGLKTFANINLNSLPINYCSSTLNGAIGCWGWNFQGLCAVYDLSQGGSPGYVRAVRNF